MKENAYDKKNQTPESTAVQHSRRPRNPNKPEHNRATATVYIEGLSVLCYNNSDANIANHTVEVGFVEAEHTPVKIRVYHNDCKSEFWRFDCPDNRKVRIEIKKSQPRGPGEFFEKDKTDPEDFKYMPDLNGADWHPNASISLNRNARNYISALLVLKDAKFFTRLPSVYDAIQTIPTSPPTPRNLGKIGRIVGADIECDRNDTGIDIKVIGWNSATGAEEILGEKHLPKGGSKFIISLQALTTVRRNHLHHIYHIINLPVSEPHFEMRYAQREPEWSPCGFVGDKNAAVKIVYRMDSSDAEEIPTENRIYFKSIEEAEDAGYERRLFESRSEISDVGILSTEFACQVFPGGDGSYGTFPPSN